ncbi:GDSL-type esterase/lipase family protein [Erwinia aphidicola]|uniref:tail fiber/spike domain-containing protein n=1 Tax=Erwinia aphidicola TaxID=68334 RepID=UPI003D19F0B5
MATQPTQNPVPSESPRDLKFNAGKIDEFVTSMGWTYTDRFGVQHYTIEGMRWLAQQAISAFGYITLDSFEDGHTLTLPNQVLRLESTGEYYRWDGAFPKSVPANSTPESTGGIGTGKWLSVGDAALRSDLSGPGGAQLVFDGEQNVSEKLAEIPSLLSAKYQLKNSQLLGIANNILRTGGNITIVCQGDSLTAGHDTVSADRIPSPYGNPFTVAPIQYPSRLESKLELLTSSAVTVINRGYSGDTAMLSYNRWATNPGGHVCHLMLGINDSELAGGETFEQFCEYYEKIIRRHIDEGRGVVLHTATPGVYGQNDGGSRYTQYVRSIASAYGCPVFESEGVIQYCKHSSVYSDIYHFNKAGYSKYGDAVASFILAGSWVRPVREITAYAAQQPGRATEGIGWWGKNTAIGFNILGSFVFNGQTGGMAQGTESYHSFSFYLGAEAANVYMVGDIATGEISLSQAETTVDGQRADNVYQPKFMPAGITETGSYAAPVRPSSVGRKSWVGALVGRGWKTVYLHNLGTNGLNLCYLIIEPCAPEDVLQVNAPLTKGTKEVLLYKWPVVGRFASGGILASASKMPLTVDIPLPRGMHRQSQSWNFYWDSFTFNATMKIVGTADPSKEGVQTMVGVPNGGASFNLYYPFRSQTTLLLPSSVTMLWSDPDDAAGTLNTGFPTLPDARVILRLAFPNDSTNVEAYYTLEVECNGPNKGYGAWLD